jgi:hypothetical protein
MHEWRNEGGWQVCLSDTFHTVAVTAPDGRCIVTSFGWWEAFRARAFAEMLAEGMAMEEKVVCSTVG